LDCNGVTASIENYYGGGKVVVNPPGNIVAMNPGFCRAVSVINTAGAQTFVYLPDPETMPWMALGPWWVQVQNHETSTGPAYVYDIQNNLLAGLNGNGVAWFGCHSRLSPGVWSIYPGTAPVTPAIDEAISFASPINGELVEIVPGQEIPVSVGVSVMVPG
jgi:hypothetical protein